MLYVVVWPKYAHSVVEWVNMCLGSTFDQFSIYTIINNIIIISHLWAACITYFFKFPLLMVKFIKHISREDCSLSLYSRLMSFDNFFSSFVTSSYRHIKLVLLTFIISSKVFNPITALYHRVSSKLATNKQLCPLYTAIATVIVNPFLFCAAKSLFCSAVLSSLLL